MEASEFMPRLSESLTARRVFSDPVQQDGVTVITAAAVRGGGGTGRGSERETGGGGGMGIGARPVGAYVICNGEVSWKPAIDFTRVIFRGQIVALSALLAFAWALSRRRKS